VKWSKLQGSAEKWSEVQGRAVDGSAEKWSEVERGAGQSRAVKKRAVQCGDKACIAGEEEGQVSSCTSLSPLRMRQGCTIGGKPSNPKYKHTELCSRQEVTHKNEKKKC
jgi:hypothetical protein